jgi:hypothetical protein
VSRGSSAARLVSSIRRRWIYSVPPQQQQPRERERKRAGRGKGKQPATSGSVVVKSALEPINERPHHQIRQDAATSTTDLAAQEGSAGLGQETGVRHREYTRRRSTRLRRCSLLSGGETPILLVPYCQISVLSCHCIVMMEPTLCAHTQSIRSSPHAGGVETFPSFLMLFFPST